jgi:hypothetical protein
MKKIILLLFTIILNFNAKNSFSQERVMIDQDQLVTVDQVFKIIKQQTEYRFMYPKELFNNTPKVQLKKGEITVIKLLKKSLVDINFNFEITNNNTIVIKKKAAIKNSKQQQKIQPTIISGFVFDKKSKESLPYATIKLLNTESYTIANEDGKFEFVIKQNMKVDSLEIRFMGFQTKRVAISEIKNDKFIYLSPNVASLNEVYVTNKKGNKKKKQYEYNLLYSLIQKYRKNNTAITGKSFLSLTSSARDTPIEQLEGFYNCTQSLAEGIIDLNIKRGRFGQNKSFPFYSLDNTIILKDFKLFKKQDQMLPRYPGNMSYSKILSKYYINTDLCTSCDNKESTIYFTPKKNKSNLFSGTIYFNKEKLIIQKIELDMRNPIIEKLSSIDSKDIVVPKELKLNINFNPLNNKSIQYIDFKFVIDYQSENTNEIIESNTFIYFYDFNNPFVQPYFTNSIEFNNDYDKIIALQTSEEFWKLNTQFPKSYNEKRTMKFMEKFGLLINYDNTIPLDYLKVINTASVVWDEKNRLQWEEIKENTDPEDEFIIREQLKSGNALEVDNISLTISDLEKFEENNFITEKFVFSYIVDRETTNDNSYFTRTVFDRGTSFFNGQRTDKNLMYINLIFDVYEYFRREIEHNPNQGIVFEELKEISEKTFIEATEIVAKMKTETNSGDNFQSLMRWNNKIKSKLNIDNYSLIVKKKVNEKK